MFVGPRSRPLPANIAHGDPTQWKSWAFQTCMGCEEEEEAGRCRKGRKLEKAQPATLLLLPLLLLLGKLILQLGPPLLPYLRGGVCLGSQLQIDPQPRVLKVTLSTPQMHFRFHLFLPRGCLLLEG